jgi:Domain of unknown function (DUF4440)
LQSKDLKKYMALRDRFVGWPDYVEHPVRKSEIEKYVAEDFRTPQPTVQSLVAPQPESITLFGNVAVTYYFWLATNDSSKVKYRVTHTWVKRPGGWRIIGGMSCAVPQSNAGHETQVGMNANRNLAGVNWLLLTASLLFAHGTRAQKAPELRGAWTASAGSTTFRGSWGAELSKSSPNSAVGWWTLVN